MGLRALFLALFCATAAAANPRTLTESDFDDATRSGVWFLMLHAPNCGGCQVLGPLFDALTDDAAITAAGVNIARVNCGDAKTVCERFGVQNLSLKVVTGGRYYNYVGTRDQEQLANFALAGYKNAQFSDPVLSYQELLEQRELARREASEFETDSKVVTLTSADIDVVLKGSKNPWLIKFYAPWCGYCKHLAPTWHRLAKSLDEKKSEFKIAKVDCEVERRACSRFGIANYPSLFLVKDDHVYTYKHGRSLKALQEFTEIGWKEAELVGPIEDESFWSDVGNSLVEWGMENKVLAIIAIIVLSVLFVMIPILFLNNSEVDSWRKLPKPKATAASEKTSNKAATSTTTTTSTKKKKPKVE